MAKTNAIELKLPFQTNAETKHKEKKKNNNNKLEIIEDLQDEN